MSDEGAHMCVSPGRVKPSDLRAKPHDTANELPSPPSTTRKASFLKTTETSEPVESPSLRKRGSLFGSTSRLDSFVGGTPSPRGSFRASSARGSFMQEGSPRSSRRLPPHADAMIGGRHLRITREQVTTAFTLLTDGLAPPSQPRGARCETPNASSVRAHSPSHQHSLKQKDLKRRLDVLCPQFGTKEYRTLIPDGASMTADALWAHIVENIEHVSVGEPYCHVDPAAEVLSRYDPSGSGFVNPGALLNVFHSLGYDSMSVSDVSELINSSDGDGDGYLNVDDMRDVLGFYPARKPHSSIGTAGQRCDSEGEED